MRRTVSTLVCAVAMATGSTLIAQSQSQSPTPAPAQAGAQDARPAGQMTVNGCVYRTSDETAMFALEHTSDADSTGTQPSTADPASQANVRGAVGTAGRTTMTPGGGPTAAPGTSRVPWYRLSQSGQPDLATFVGRAVRVTGTITPSSAASAAPNSAGAPAVGNAAPATNGQIKAADLTSAPQLVVQEIAAVEGQCRTTGNVGGAQQR